MGQASPLAQDALDVDARLTEIERELNLLLNVTPVNGADAWRDFERSGFESVPTLQSRALEFDADLLRRGLYDIEIERVESQPLNSLFRAKRDEIARQITMLEDRGTTRFRYGALQLYGEPGESLCATARSLLDAIDPQPITSPSVTATAFAEAARTELESYRSAYPEFPVVVEIRDDAADLMVSFGRLYIPATAAFRKDRVEPLIQHEVGTHVLTYRNGEAQPLQLLAVGLPAYEETQEGLALLAEYVVGGLDPRRMRVLAARVVAASMMLAHTDFVAIFKHLTDHHGFAPRTAWSVTSRATYGGGSTKDIIYLRGIERVLRYFAEGRSIDPLLAGKLSLDHAPLVDELIQQGVLKPPWARPHWLCAPGSEERFERVRAGMTAADLIETDVIA
ncbi:flavohemoglobin expression-modulating QEGLA motif protein [Mycobacterium sp. LTG2003]